ncbi:zinc ribbon domain-containing protein [Slackia piriformis]|nr:zinc ribbon domain-containing protein [Slackia piriformis]
MAICDRCGTKVPDDSVFCDQCGSRISQKPDGATAVRSRVPLVVVGIAVVAAVFLIVVGAGALLGSKGGTLDQEQILSSYRVGDQATGEMSASEWVSNEGFVITSSEVTSVTDFESEGVPCKLAAVQVVYENGFLMVTDQSEITFRQEDGQWNQVGEPYGINRQTVPVSGIPDETIAGAMPAIIDSMGVESASNAYNQDATFEVTSSETDTVPPEDAQRDSLVMVNMEGSFNGQPYTGRMMLTFNWDGADWKLSNAAFDQSTEFPGVA